MSSLGIALWQVGVSYWSHTEVRTSVQSERFVHRVGILRLRGTERCSLRSTALRMTDVRGNSSSLHSSEMLERQRPFVAIKVNGTWLPLLPPLGSKLNVIVAEPSPGYDVEYDPKFMAFPPL